MKNNKIIKLIYKLRVQKNGVRKIKYILQNTYNINCMEKDIKYVVSRIPYRRDKFCDLDKRKILYLYSRFINTHKLIAYLNLKYDYQLTYSRITDLASENGVKKESQNMYLQSYITRNDEYEIVRLYNYGLTSNEIANIYGYKTRNSILQKLEKHNINRRDCNEEQSINKSYYDFSMQIVDSEFKAYFLGLMLTDGYVNIERNYIGIDLSDEDAIKFLSEHINTKYIRINNPKCKDKYRIILYGKKLVREVSRLGLISRKSLVLEGPVLDKYEMQFLPYILRGIIDGDGWIRKDGNEFFIASASINFINWCKNSLEGMDFENISVNYIPNEYNGIYIIRSGIKYNIEQLKSRIYNKPFGMNRKYYLLQ